VYLQLKLVQHRSLELNSQKFPKMPKELLKTMASKTECASFNPLQKTFACQSRNLM
jgi:hypothetical protein